MTEKILFIKDWVYKTWSKEDGITFYENILLPNFFFSINNNVKLIIVLDDVLDGYGSLFFKETFVKLYESYGANLYNNYLEIVSTNSLYKSEIEFLIKNTDSNFLTNKEVDKMINLIKMFKKRYNIHWDEFSDEYSVKSYEIKENLLDSLMYYINEFNA